MSDVISINDHLSRVSLFNMEVFILKRSFDSYFQLKCSLLYNRYQNIFNIKIIKKGLIIFWMLKEIILFMVMLYCETFEIISQQSCLH